MSPAPRLPFLELLRMVASQAIVCHHLAFYGPLSDSARAVATTLIDWLAEHGRLSVQVFFVVSGYLTAKSLLKKEVSRFRDVGSVLLGRYRRIGVPYLGALVLAILANEVARRWMTHPSISDPPTPGQLLAHVLLVHDLVGYEPLSAGIWYLAIDLQLVTLMAVAFWISGRVAGRAKGPELGRALLGALGLLSLFWFNRQPDFDHLAIYFLGSYLLGCLVAWRQAGLVARSIFWGYAALVLAAVALEFRSRLLVALGTGIVLVMAERGGWMSRWPRSRTVQELATVSYSLFLVHFPVCLVINAWWSRHLPTDPWWALGGMIVAYAGSLVAAFAFHYGFERTVLATARTRTAASEATSANPHA